MCKIEMVSKRRKINNSLDEHMFDMYNNNHRNDLCGQNHFTVRNLTKRGSDYFF